MCNSNTEHACVYIYMAMCKNPCSFWGVILGLRQGGAPPKLDEKPGSCHSRAWFGLFCNKNKWFFTRSWLLLIKPMVFHMDCAQLGWAGQNGTGSFACKSNSFSKFFHRPAPRFPEQKLMGNRQVDPEVRLGGAGPPLPVTKRSFAYDRMVLSTFMRRQASKKAHLCFFGGMRRYLRRIYIYIYRYIYIYIYIYTYIYGISSFFDLRRHMRRIYICSLDSIFVTSCALGHRGEL